jgi:hypothetical protein
MDDRFIAGSPLPTSVGRCADLYAEVREVRLAMDKEVEAVKKRESEIREHIINNLSKSDDTGAAGLRYRAQIIVKEEVKVVDWGVLWSWAKKNDRSDTYQKRINTTMAKDWMKEEGRVLPGTEKILVPDISIQKI